MITAETGLPGAGKTLYAVDKLLRPLVGSTVMHEDADGKVQEVKRVIYSNINGLLLEHEKIDAGASWTHDGKTDTWSQPQGGDKFGLNNWHEWAKPGSVIVFDEIQKPWPLSAAGSKVSPCITALETHRHMGVDFIVMTQHPMLIHANLVRLVGRHLHIRRMGNMGLAIVYEWDSCSRTLLYKNAFAKSPYRYAKDVFKLYKSAELHTKQPRKMPSLVWGVGIGLAAMAYFGPVAYSRIAERINPPPVVAKVAEPKVTTTVTVHPAGQKFDVVKTVDSLAVAVPAEEVVSGCARSATACRCYTATAKVVDKPQSYCQAETTVAAVAAPPVQFSQISDVFPRMATPADLELIEWSNRRRRQQ
jgi:zona occludens toxin